MRTLIGGVGPRYQRDASFGLHVSDALEAEALDAGVEVRDLGYGALLAAHDILEADPAYDRLVLVASVIRGREPGLYERRPDAADADPDEILARIREAGAGVVDLDHLLVVGRYLGALPPTLDVRLIELEPWDVNGGEGLSPEAVRVLPDALARTRAAARARTDPRTDEAVASEAAAGERAESASRRREDR